jgi:hypothetical protein
MTDIDNEPQPTEHPSANDERTSEQLPRYYFKIRFREPGQ